MKKPVVFLWLAFILGLCFPLSYIVNVNENTLLRPGDFKILVIVCAPLAFILLGLCCWGVYFVMKKQKTERAAQKTLVIFTALVVGICAVSSAKFGEKMRERNDHFALRDMREGFIEGCTSKMKIIPALKQVDSLEQRVNGFCTCAYDRLESVSEIREMMLHSEDPYNAMTQSEEAQKIAKECFETYFANVMQ